MQRQPSCWRCKAYRVGRKAGTSNEAYDQPFVALSEAAVGGGALPKAAVRAGEQWMRIHVCAVSASGMLVWQGPHSHDQMMAISDLDHSCRAPASRSPSESCAVWEPIWWAALDPGAVSCWSSPAKCLLVTIRRCCCYKACLAGAAPAAAPASLELEQLRQDSRPSS